MADTLIFTPTYNEAGNIAKLIEQVYALGLAADMLVVDDSSPDGTGDIVERLKGQYKGLALLRRPGKQGIGGAHIAALRYAKMRGYKRVVSMDADFSHRPTDIPRLVEKLGDQCDVVVGTRYMNAESLKEWNPYRRAITHFGHFLTKTLLDLPYDASGGLRAYALDKVPLSLFDVIQSRDYEFFFESLTLLHFTGVRIGEVPIDLPARAYGHSKMELSHMFRGISRLCELALRLRLGRSHLRAALAGDGERPEERDMRDAWDTYWAGKHGKRVERSAYDVVASFYRNYLIKPTLNRSIRATFAPGAEILHAGCGGGEVDDGVVAYARVTALDISPNALTQYASRNPQATETRIADIFDLSTLPKTYDGVYNLGVMEHFSEEQISMILTQFNQSIKMGGKIVLFWPPVYGVSVIGLSIIHFVLNTILKRNIELHPPEPTKVRSREQVSRLLKSAGFDLQKMSFGLQDAFTYVIVFATKNRDTAAGDPAKDRSVASLRATG